MVELEKDNILAEESICPRAQQIEMVGFGTPFQARVYQKYSNNFLGKILNFLWCVYAPPVHVGSKIHFCNIYMHKKLGVHIHTLDELTESNVSIALGEISDNSLIDLETNS